MPTRHATCLASALRCIPLHAIDAGLCLVLGQEPENGRHANQHSLRDRQNGGMTKVDAVTIKERLPAMAAVIHRVIPGSEVRLFGSRARGPVGPDSDIDLLITAPDSWLEKHHRFEVLNALWDQLSQADMSLDLLLYSQSECEARRHWRSHVIGRAYPPGGPASAWFSLKQKACCELRQRTSTLRSRPLTQLFFGRALGASGCNKPWKKHSRPGYFTSVMKNHHSPMT